MSRIVYLALALVVIVAVPGCNLFRSSAPPSVAAIPSVALTIQAQVPAGGFTVGQVVSYQYTVTNTGSVSLKGPVTVTDNKIMVLCPNLNTVGNRDNNLDPGESVVCSGSYTLTQADITAGSMTNNAAATIAGASSAPASAVVRAPENKVLALTKSASTTSYTQAGQTITFTYVITNTGAVPLGPTQFVVTDDHIVTPINCGAPGTTLAANQTLTCSANYVTSQADVNAGSVTSSAIATGGGAGTAQPASVTLTLAGGGGGAGIPNPSGLARGSTVQYKVVKGEWLIQIARCFGADATAVSRANPQIIDPDEISPDEVLTIPNIGSSGTIYGPPCITFHTVQSGDTWNSIAQKYNADVVVLQAANRGESLSAGNQIRVPLNSAGGSPGTGATPIVTQNPNVCNQAQMVSDVTIPDGSTVSAGSAFTKTWRLKNAGTCTWTSAYALVFDHGQQMDAPATLPLTTVNVPPGGTVDVSVPLRAPSTPGTYQADFRLRAADGVIFGIGANAQGSFWVKIVASTATTTGATAVPPTSMPSTGSSDVVGLLGKKIMGGPEIQAFQAAYTDGPCPETATGSGILECKSKAGEAPFVRLVASSPADLVNSTIVDVRVFPKYTGTLPEGLNWTMTETAIEAKLGAPLSEPVDNGNNTMDAEYKTASGLYRLWVTYDTNADPNVALMRKIRIALK
ncbi:MAG: NBR1-Ig-like domain-containing protein [Bacteroidota bacterium]